MVSWTLSIRTPLRRTTALQFPRSVARPSRAGVRSPVEQLACARSLPCRSGASQLRGPGPLAVHGVHAVRRDGRVLHFRIGTQQAEKTVALILQPGCEVDRGWIVDGAAARGESPEILDHDRLPVGPVHLAHEMIVLRVEGVDGAVAKIADQEVSGKVAKARGRDGETPGRIERAARRHSLQMSPIQVEFVDEAVTRSRDIVMLGGVLFRKGDEQMSVEHLNVEWRKARRHVWIGEAVDLFEIGIEDVDGAAAEIRRVKA